MSPPDGPCDRTMQTPDGARIAYGVRGQRTAPVLLLLRPLGGSCALWGAFVESLEPKFRVVMFDPRGRGRSGPTRPRTTTRTMARDAVAVLDQLRVGRAHVFGLSLGGMVACWLAADAPTRVRRLVLASTPMRALAVAPGNALRGAAMARCLVQSGGDAEACMVRCILDRRFRTAHRETVARIEAMARSMPTSRTSVIRLLRAAATHDARAIIPGIDQPTLVLAGERDRLVTVRASTRMTQSLPRARLVVLPGVGHDASLEAPHELARIVTDFLRKN